MSYASRGSGGGGGGFGNFPYRSAHQQNSDGNANANANANGRRNRRRTQNRHQKRHERGGALTCRVSLKVPVHRHGAIIGRRGQTIKKLTNRTRTVINVPGMRNTNPNARVQIQGSCVAYVLHACWEVSQLVQPLPSSDENGTSAQDGAGDEDEDEEAHIEYELVIQGVDGILKGQMMRRGIGTGTRNNDPIHNAFMVGQKQEHDSSVDVDEHGISAYCIPTREGLLEDTISIWVDNERFVDSNITAMVDIIPISGGTNTTTTVESNEDLDGDDGKEEEEHYGESSTSMLIFIYGMSRERPGQLYSALTKKLNEYENA